MKSQDNKITRRLVIIVWFKILVFRLEGERVREDNKMKFCMKSDEKDQDFPPPHPSRTATGSKSRLHVPRRNPENLRYFVPSRISENS
ncbi:hypothetical protein E3N88_29198 [Mikania micrantha]|uniref:Uncharacterized protein n=1 Tax=Mikania micrantha TaxID=192012 RepID=A0A5N6MI53_9ASTR|nr:hypothetical protein E3N88_29198 [Mikania micrantha]